MTHAPRSISTVKLAIIDEADYNAVLQFMQKQERKIPIVTVADAGKKQACCTSIRTNH